MNTTRKWRHGIMKQNILKKKIEATILEALVTGRVYEVIKLFPYTLYMYSAVLLACNRIVLYIY
jgi:hypothetical protein